ncbi:MAG: hypothetical protein GY952_09785 [Rhodobacteraceae bacterium]|nr:hypothetical protein [Paracoccaceae bacterium]
MRTFFRVLGILIMVFTGGCSLFFVTAGGFSGVDFLGTALLVGGVPFAVGLVIFLLARPND